jgi:hypothetical protein
MKQSCYVLYPLYVWPALSETVKVNKTKTRNPKRKPKFPNPLMFTVMNRGIYPLRDVTSQKPVRGVLS